MIRNRLRTATLLAATVVVAGCSSSGSTAGGTPGSDVDAGGSTATGDAAAATDAGVNVDPGSTLTTSIGPIDLPASAEKTVCIITHVDNADALFVTRMVVDLAPGSHHLIIYQAADNAVEQTTPTPCRPFSGITSGEKPIMIVEKPHDDLVFPTNVALKFGPHQKVKLEAHYINTTAAPLQGSGSARFEGLPPEKAVGIIESNLTFWGPLSFSLPPHAVSKGPMTFQAGIAGTKGFALTTHQHRLGTHVRVWSSAQSGDMSTQIADTTDWAEPPLYRLSPELSFNGTNGLSFQCEWNNTTDGTVSFGESANDEMCFTWMYYYPSHGFDICIGGRCTSR